LERGRRVREVLKQPQYYLLSVPAQIAVFVAVNRGLFDGLPAREVSAAERSVCEVVETRLHDVASHILAGKKLDDQQISRILSVAREACARPEPVDANH
jgi:F-type H+-transporting ATPase subunit alpha